MTGTERVRTGGAVVRLADGETSVERVGAKAARLADLVGHGFEVPDGVVIPVDVVAGDDDLLVAAVREACTLLGDGSVAVRSSAVAEDSGLASFAGLYDTVLDVAGEDEVISAVRRVAASAVGDRVTAYDPAAGTAIAVLVQRMVRADVAGVAFTASPITGARQEVHLTAVRGLGEELVSGRSVGEDWVVTSSTATCTGQPSILNASDAKRVAQLARSVEALDGTPQDIEWAIADGELWLLQARPMTAVPDEVSWEPEGLKGWWRRDFRIGEWLPEPVTPLFETWFLPSYEAAFERYCWAQVGMATKPPYNVVVNGWCFGGVGGTDRRLVGAMLRRPGYTFRSVVAVARMFTDPAPLERISARPSLERFRADVLPRYRERVAVAGAEVDTANPQRLVELVDSICDSFGEMMLPVAETLGFAYKSELALAAFHRRHLAPSVDGSPMTLLGGLGEPATAPSHSVVSLDWVHPTLGERVGEGPPPSAEGHAVLVAARLDAEQECRGVLAGDPKLLRRFDRLLSIAQEYAPVRQEIAGVMTIGWPVTRRALARLGSTAVARGAIAQVDDVFFLTRDELAGAVLGGEVGDLSGAVAERRDLRGRRSLLVPPERVGPRKSNHERGAKKLGLDRGRVAGADDPGTILGQPSSPGTATGPVRVVTSPDEFDRVQPGDILVAQVTTPGWTPLFPMIAGVVTDGGSVAAHASIVAREYGIPAVVGTLDATKRLTDGEVVTVDGGHGIVRRAEPG